MNSECQNNFLGITWNHQNITFEKCGLDVKKNFLQNPICQKCYSDTTHLLLEDEDDAVISAEDFVYENYCNNCGVFIIMANNTVVFALKLGENEDDIASYQTDYLGDYMNIGAIAECADLHCYGLIVHEEGNKYRVVEI